MAGFMRTLAKMGLVELEEKDLPPPAPDATTDLDKLLAETRALTASVDDAPRATPDDAPPPPPPPAAVSLPPLPVAGITDERPLDALYAEAGVPTTAFPAEKLLKVLEGLAAMDLPVRRAAVAAMDAADDAWTIADPLLDASRKVAVLEAAKGRLDQTLTAAEAKAQADTEAQDAYAAEATRTIRAQIAELEATLAQELGAVGENKARILSELEGARAARTHQVARLQAEIQRLQSLYPVFGDGGPASTRNP